MVWVYLESFRSGASKRAFDLNIVQVFAVIKLGLVQVWIWHDMGSFLGLWIGSEFVRLLHIVVGTDRSILMVVNKWGGRKMIIVIWIKVCLSSTKLKN